jgi:hypothetical protein
MKVFLIVMVILLGMVWFGPFLRWLRKGFDFLKNIIP